MKKLVLIAMVAAFASSVFAQDNKHMVRFYGFENGSTANSVDFNFSTTENVEGSDDDASTNTLAFNWAYAVTDALQLGIFYRNAHTAGDTTNYGVSGFWNFQDDLTKTNYVGLSLGASEDPAEDMGTTVELEYGHRWNLASFSDMNLTFAPAVTYAMTTIEHDDDNLEDEQSQSFQLNLLKFDLFY